ncbi:cytochrome b6 [Carboxydothermus ferrireducens]|uniref:Cytochrome c peroxidase n=1 Tax=Carboxydothermus ferrireducens DSM 11255 TaxID=1119529 RepID=A0ABX2R729_9THEO|nr:cytochrome b6 [Carboxydothermus ferrireducens]NYE56377.1 cytochrome c peroxidase [Carboxydothermus ferrireducens DSM 11255]
MKVRYVPLRPNKNLEIAGKIFLLIGLIYLLFLVFSWGYVKVDKILRDKSFSEIMKEEKANKPKIMAKQRKLLEERYNLTPKTTTEVTMSGGKPLPVGPTAKLKNGLTFEDLASMSPEEIKEKGVFPYLPLPHPHPQNGGMVFPPVQTKIHPELVRFDVDFDLPDAFLPEFPPPLYLTTHPELGDVSKGKEITLDNYYELFKDILTPVQLEGLRLLLTKFPQQQFNATDDRKSEKPSLGVSCFDCHVNSHTTGQFHLNPDNRPQETRFRIDTVSLRGTHIQQLFGSKRSIRSVEDFCEFEQRSAYFDGDHTLAAKKGINPLSREQVMHMAQFINIIDFPPAPKLNRYGRLNPAKATEKELLGEKIFFGKGKCGYCHPAPYYTDQLMHDLKVERFYQGRPEGPIKTFTLRGLKDSPPYFHDGRLLTIEDTVEFFNLVLELKLTREEKEALVAFLRQL